MTKLTALDVKRAKRGKHGFGNGLYLYVHAGNSRSWVLRYGPQGRREMGLGATHVLTLAEARERARECRKLLLDGIDPIAARREGKTAAKIAAAKSMTFAQCADIYFEAHRAGWRAAKHATEWRQSLRTYAEPVIGDLPVQNIDTSLVLKVVQPIWRDRNVTAKRVRQRIEVVLDAAKAQGLRDGENPARWRGHLDKLLAAPDKVRKVKHYVALPYAEVSAFMAKLRAH
jgi:hypothetical protein